MTRFVVRKLDDVGIAPLGNLVKADVYHVVAEGNRVLAEATAQGRRAYDSALEQGRKDGEAEGRKANAALMADAATTAQHFWRRSERRLVNIVMEALRRVLGHFEDAELAAGMVRQLLREVADEGKIRLRVCPDQLPAIRDRAREMQGGTQGIDSIEVVADASVDAGACRMETELGFVETSIDAQLEVLRAALEKDLEE